MVPGLYVAPGPRPIPRAPGLEPCQGVASVVHLNATPHPALEVLGEHAGGGQEALARLDELWAPHPGPALLGRREEPGAGVEARGAGGVADLEVGGSGACVRVCVVEDARMGGNWVGEWRLQGSSSMCNLWRVGWASCMR